MNTKTEQTNFSHGSQKTISLGVKLVESGLLPDTFIRFGIRQLIKQRLKEENSNNAELNSLNYHSFIQSLKEFDLAIDTDKANEQHYEINSDFYELVLGSRKKYSSCYYTNDSNLNEAELNMLELYTDRAQIKDGQNILELGCGWGSLTLYLAEKFPNAQITGVSNSHSQRKYIMLQATKWGLDNIEIITCDINEFSTDKKYGRIVSIEMFEHIRNYGQLFENISRWLTNDGLLFIHVFCHRYLMYPFNSNGDDNWMGKYFFTGGQMPAADTFLNFQEHLSISQRWMMSGSHYEKTSNDWLKNMDKNKSEVLHVLKKIYADKYLVWYRRWRIFFMSCAELFGYNNGNEWLVGHYLFSNKA